MRERVWQPGAQTCSRPGHEGRNTQVRSISERMNYGQDQGKNDANSDTVGFPHGIGMQGQGTWRDRSNSPRALAPRAAHLPEGTHVCYEETNEHLVVSAWRPGAGCEDGWRRGWVDVSYLDKDASQ